MVGQLNQESFGLFLVVSPNVVVKALFTSFLRAFVQAGLGCFFI
jgi:hypothetical protein